jgi:CubicO group peptidase (beta-lactamase class C family)
MNRTFSLSIVISALSICQFATARELPTTKPEEVGMSSDKLALVVPAMKKLVDQQKVAGAVAVVARQGKIVLFEAVGQQDIAAQKPMKRDTIARIYSMTKPITSVAVMILVEEGKLALDDPVAKYLPEFKDVKVFAGVKDGKQRLTKPERPPTIRDLLRHTSGLTYGFFGNTDVDQRYRKVNMLDRGSTLVDMAKKLGELPLLDQPGTRFRYSVSTDVLGRIVEVVSGEDFDDFLHDRIFTPLGMKDTGFAVSDGKLDRFAVSYGRKLFGGLRVMEAPQLSIYRRYPKLLSGGGGLVSTARDYIRFCQMLLNRGELNGRRVLRAESVEAMTTNQLPDKAYPIRLGVVRPGVGFGLGFSVVVEKTKDSKRSRVGEYGWGGAASTHFWISPKDDLAVVVLTQLMPFNFQMEHAVKPLVYDAILEATETGGEDSKASGARDTADTGNPSRRADHQQRLENTRK